MQKKRKLLNYSINVLITNYTHVGFKRNLLNHNFRKAVLGLYSNIAIINPATTLANLRLATKFLFDLAFQEHKIGFVFFNVPSFVKSKPKKFFKSHYYVLDYWPSGLVSNFFFVYESTKLFAKSCSEFPALPGGLFVVANCHTDKAMSIAKECRKLILPAFFVLDSVSNLAAFQYWIPANLKSEYSIQFFFYHAVALINISELHYKKMWAAAAVEAYKKRIQFIFKKLEERRKLESRLTVMQFSKFIYTTKKRLKYLRFFRYTMSKRRWKKTGDINLLKTLKTGSVEGSIPLKPRKKVFSRRIYRFFRRHYLETNSRALFWRWYSLHYYRWKKRMLRVGYRINRFQKSWKQEIKSKRRFRWAVLKSILGIDLYKQHQKYFIRGKWRWRRRKLSFFNQRFNIYDKNQIQKSSNKSKSSFKKKKEKRKWLPHAEYVEWKKRKDLLAQIRKVRELKLERKKARLNKILRGRPAEIEHVDVNMEGFQKWKKKMLSNSLKNKELQLFDKRSNKIKGKAEIKQLKKETKTNFFVDRFKYSAERQLKIKPKFPVVNRGKAVRADLRWTSYSSFRKKKN